MRLDFLEQPLRFNGQHHAEADDEVADEGTRRFKPAAGGAAIQVGRFGHNGRFGRYNWVVSVGPAN